MKIINIDIDDKIILKNILDTDTKTKTSINYSFKLATGNYQSILLNFNFVSPNPDDLSLFANFKISSEQQIDVELDKITIDEVTYQYACYIPKEVFEKVGKTMLGVFGLKLNENNNLEKRISLIPIMGFIVKGSYDPSSKDGITPTPTIFEIYFNKVKNIENELEIYKNDYENFVSLYNSKPYYFENIAALKKSKLKENDVVITLGYYEINDGGGALYIIRTKTENDVEDEGLIHFLSDNLVAELIIENNTINIKQLGARSQDTSNNKYDIKPYLEKYKTILNNLNNKVKLYIPSGIWYSTPFEIANIKGFDIYGDFGFNITYGTGTIISTLEDNQEYLFNLGNNLIKTKNWNIENITFSTANYKYNINDNAFKVEKVKQVINYVVRMLYLTFGVSDNLFFLYCDGETLRITSCWENYYKLINFRGIKNIDGGILNFYTTDKTLNENANITACTFENIMFEGILGDLILCSEENALCNCIINNLNVEDNDVDLMDIMKTTIPTDGIDAISHSIINVKGMFECDINNIILNNYPYFYCEYEGKNYVYDTIFTITNDYGLLKSNINNVNITGMKKDCNFIKNKIENRPAPKSTLNINNINIANNSSVSMIFNTPNFPYINYEGRLNNINANEYILPTNAIDFAKCVYRSNSASRSLLSYDIDSQNNKKLCVRMVDKENIHCQFIVTGTNITIRSKIPVDTFARIVLSKEDGTYKSFNIDGNNEFKLDTVDISDKISIGDRINLKFSSSSTCESCLLDYFIFN